MGAELSTGVDDESGEWNWCGARSKRPEPSIQPSPPPSLHERVQSFPKPPTDAPVGEKTTLAPLRTTPAPLRILCLHGSGSSKNAMKLQLRALQFYLKHRASFEYLESPVVWDNPVDPGLHLMFGDGPFFGWWNEDGDGEHFSDYADFHRKLNDASCEVRYTGTDAALDLVEREIARSGPFDALCGFSQGAILISLLTARLERRREEGGAGPSWKMNLLISAMPPRDVRYTSALGAAAPLQTPAVLLLGRRDPFYEAGHRLAKMYTSATVLEHEQGHELPKREDAAYDQLVSAVLGGLELGA